MKTPWWQITSLWKNHWQPSESLVLGGAALFVGLTSGAGVWLFKRLVDLARLVAFDRLGAGLSYLGGWTVILVPVVGGLVVGLIIHLFVGEERHHGVAGIMEAVALAGGRLRYRRVPAKAIAAALYIRALYIAQDVFHEWHAPRWIKPAAAGLIIGLVGLYLPQIFGVGYETIGRIFDGKPLPLALLLALLTAKLLMTAVSIGGGFPGGVFAPSLFLGATLGGAYGLVAQKLFPALAIAPPAFAMVGMAAVLAGAVHAPLTAIILLFEMTNDYRMILPLMFAVAVSLFIAQRLQHDSVYEVGLARKGVRLERGRDVEVLEAMTVAEVMQTEASALRESDSLATAAHALMRTRSHGLPVLNQDGELAGILTLQDLDRAQTQGADTVRMVGQVCTRDLLVAHPEETIGAALKRMSARDVGRLPVVARDRPRHLLGVLRRDDVVRAYDVALARRTAMRHRAHQVRLDAHVANGMSVEEVTVEADAPCVGQRISQIAWPRDCVIATLRRGQYVLIPHGDTVLKSGDVLVAVVEGEASVGLQRVCLAARDTK